MQLCKLDSMDDSFLKEERAQLQIQSSAPQRMTDKIYSGATLQ